MVVLSVDVGIGVCGYCICKVKNLDIELIKEGEIESPKKYLLPQKINFIFEKLEKEFDEYNPVAIIVEKLYSHYRHPTTLGILAQVRGVIALLSFRKSVKFFEYSPTRARKSFLGRGNVNSEQVKRMAENVMGKKFKSTHTADAFSLVVAFSHQQKVERLLTEKYKGKGMPLPIIKNDLPH